MGDSRLLGVSGVERMRLGLNRRTLPPPIHHLTGLIPVEAGLGTSTFTMPATPWLQTPAARLLSGGSIAFVADGPLGTAIMTALGPGQVVTTSEFNLNFLRPALIAPGVILIARARLIHGGRNVGLSEVTVEDSTGRILAHGTSRCFVLDVGAQGAPPAEWPRAVPPQQASPDPYLRPVRGSTLPDQAWQDHDGLELMRRCIGASGEAAPPIHHLTGLRPAEADAGACTFTMPATPWLCAPQPFLYGGALGLLADSALSGAVQTTLPAGTIHAALDLKMQFLRPVPPDGQDLTARARVVHRGRSMSVANCEISNSEGKLVALATSSAMILPDRTWASLRSEDPEPATEG